MSAPTTTVMASVLIELFARSAREGWAAWGNQVPAEVTVPDDDLDIPEFLRRAPKAAAS